MTLSFAPTDEQCVIVDTFRTGQNTVVEAYAGTGKTTTLVMLAEVLAELRRSGIYLAFNKGIASEAMRKFTGYPIQVSTVHSLAYRSHGAPYEERMNTSKKWMTDSDYAKVVGISGGEKINMQHAVTTRKNGKRVEVSTLLMQKKFVVRAVRETVKNFLKSDARSFDEIEVTFPEPFESVGHPSQIQEMKFRVRKAAELAWEDLLLTRGGELPFSHDIYLKFWELSDPKIPQDSILYDEVQDSDPVMTSVIKKQDHAQIVVVGDREQAIYGFRGAVDAMDAFGGVHHQLTQSFRFGPDIAESANWWLEGLESNGRIRGSENVQSFVWPITDNSEDAVLVRSNAGAISEIIRAHQRGASVGAAGRNQATELRRLADACLQLKDKGWTTHRDLDGFDSWDSVVDFTEQEDAPDLALLVSLVEGFGANAIIQAIDACVPVEQARVTVATAHVAKGLEWNSLRISDDFRPPRLDKLGNPVPITREEARLAYVAVTRAKHRLDATGLAWAKHWPAGVEPKFAPAESVEEVAA